MSLRSSTSSHPEYKKNDGPWATPPTKLEDEENPPPSALADIEKGEVEARANKEARDPNIVGWDEDNDTENPRNWSTGYKSWITFQLGMLALTASLGSSIISPANNTIARYTGVSSEVVVLSVSLYMYASINPFSTSLDRLTDVAPC